MKSSDAQKSEVHESTADAGGSPTADADEQATLEHARRRHEMTPVQQHRMPEPLVGSTVIVQDDTDVGGPLVIKSDDPELNPPHVPSDPFPTDRTPEIDPPIDD